MTLNGLTWRNLFYHWRGNLAVLLGVWVGAAVLTGALLVGDSLRGSLRDRTLKQLAGVESALIGGRFVRLEVADGLPGTIKPCIFVQGTVRTAPKVGDPVSVTKVALFGVDRRFWADATPPEAEGLALSAPLAAELKVAVGDRVEISTQAIAAIPRSSPLGQRTADDAMTSFTVPVAAILPLDHPASAFSLMPSTATPMNAFLPLAVLQKQLKQTNRVNAIFASGADVAALNTALKERLTLDDWGVTVEVPPTRNAYVSVGSRQLLLEPFMVEATHAAADAIGARHADTFVYLANWIAHGDRKIPYSLVAALDPAAAAPHGPFLPAGVTSLADDEIVLVDWKESPITAKPGDAITLTYFEPEVEGTIREKEATFTFKGLIPLDGVADDRDLTPEFPGITDKASVADWNPPFPYDGKRVQRRDESFWSDHRTTPKAYITLAAGQKLWSSRFGDVTTVRLAKDDTSPADLVPIMQSALLKRLNPDIGGLTFDPIRERLLTASKGGNDFGMLFVAFSFFLIAAALMLVGLLFRLNIDRRASELGVLRAAGYPDATVRRMLIGEGLIVAVVGAALGLVAAVWYADGMLSLFARFWPSKEAASILTLHVTPMSLVIGFVATVFMAMATVWFTARVLAKVEPRALIHGETSPSRGEATSSRGRRWSFIVAGIGIVGAIALGLMAPSMPPGEAQAGTFFGSGSMLLIAALALLWAWLKRPKPSTVAGHGVGALARLGSRNASRNPTRSILTAGLIASAAFLIVAVESFRRTPGADFENRDGGSGGFALVAETDLPVFQGLNQGEDGREDVLSALKAVYQRQSNAIEAEKRKDAAAAELDKAKIVPVRLKSGDDASCLNLYQATRPRLIGVPDSLIERGGFRFAATLDGEKGNEWQLLRKRPRDGATPVFVEQNTAMWMLKLGLGDDLELPDESGRMMKLRIVGLLQDSPFQSEVLMADAAFREHFPHLEGQRYFLVDCPAEDASTIKNLLALGLRSHGFAATESRSKVAGYLDVQNSYLDTFQLLGGFGLLLGVLGLAVVLLRGVWERRGELALLRALGYRTRHLNQMVLAENSLLLVVGLMAGVLAALASVLPHLEATVPWLRLVVVLGAVLVVGLIVAAVAVWGGVRGSLVAGLRRE